MQQWEYTMITGYVLSTKGGFIKGTDVSLLWSKPEGKEKVAEYSTPFDRMKKLGAEGWEMVNAFPVAEFRGGNNAGFTSEVVFIFKRLKG